MERMPEAHHLQPPQRLVLSELRESNGCRVARGGYPPPALTEPDLWASHPALRDTGVRRLDRIPVPVFPPAAIQVATLVARGLWCIGCEALAAGS